ncbi:MAG: DUF2892 domain-containing protein [Anaerolineales bacterium]|nr:DUF2892 domain-containing protein [Anaerolineales bacterium]
MNPTEFFDNLKANPRPVVVDLWAPWCMPCRAMTPLVKKMEKQYAGQVDVWQINADESPDLLRTLRVFGIPTMLVYRNGQEVTRRTGALPEPALASLFEIALHPETTTSIKLGIGERVIRIGAGAILAGIGVSMSSWVLILLGGVVAFTGVYDRCPIWKAITGFVAEKMRSAS